MTVFNAEAYLAASIESIQQQTFKDWEFIIVDDASTDHSLLIAESYAGKDSRIKIIRNAVNKGQTRCLNQGFALAHGGWIARQDADDISHPERFEKQWQRIQQEPALALLGTCGVMIDHADKVVGLLDVPLTHELIVWSAAIQNPFLHTSAMFRTEIVRSLCGYDEHYQIVQDYDLWTRIIRQNLSSKSTDTANNGVAPVLASSTPCSSQAFNSLTPARLAPTGLPSAVDPAAATPHVLATLKTGSQYRVANLPERLISYRHLETSLSKSGKKRTFQEALQIAQREEKNSFGRNLQPEERLLIQSFRERSDIKQQAAFLQLCKKLQYSFPLTSQQITADQQRLEAAYHLQRAGSKNQNRYDQLREVMTAFLVAPLYTLQWLKNRFLK